MRFPLFTQDWAADEELLLLEAISLYGFGSWDDISEHIGTKKPQDCQDHYLKVYIESPTTPLPSETVKPGAKLRETSPVPIPPPPKKKKTSKTMTSAPSQPELSGYMPKRREFETEFDNDAEKKVCHIEFTEEDKEDDIGSYFTDISKKNFFLMWIIFQI